MNPFKAPDRPSGSMTQDEPPIKRNLAESLYRIFAAFSIASAVGAIWGLIMAKFVHTNPLDFWPSIIGYSVWAGLIKHGKSQFQA